MEKLPNEVLLDIFSFLKCKDLLPCRLLNKRWNSLATEKLRNNCPIITISTKMEAIYFVQLSRNFIDKGIFTRIRLALNNIPLDVLTHLAQEFRNHNIELTLFRQFEKIKTDVHRKTVALLKNLQGLTYLRIESGTKLLNGVSQPLPNNFKLPIFQNLTKIIWSEADKTLCLAILQNAPSLRTLEINNWYDYGHTATLRDASVVMKHLPPNAQLSTTIPSYCTQGPAEVGYITRMCQFTNKISDLTLQPLARDGERLTPPTQAWKAAITQLLESQSMSLKNLDLHCKQIFTIPKLEKLELLKMREFAEAGIDPSCFPSLQKFAVRGDLSRNEVFGSKIWTTVRMLEFLWDREAMPVSERFLNKIGPSFPNLKQFTIHLQQLPELLKFCRSSSAPAEELCVYASRSERSSSEWNEVWENISEILSDHYPPRGNQSAKLGFLELKRMRIVDVDEGILNFVELASRRGIIKLQMLELILIGSPGFKTYKTILSRFHDTVTINSSKCMENEDEDSDGETEYYSVRHRHIVAF